MTPAKVLVIRFSSIGDIILTTPVIRCVKKEWKAEIHVLTKKSFSGIFQSNPYVDQIHEYENTNASELQNIQFDHVFDLQKNHRSKRLVKKLGFASSSFDKLNIKKWLYVNTKFNVLPEKHLVDRYFEAILHLGIYDDGEGCDYFYNMDKVAETVSGLAATKYNVLVLGAAHATKRISLFKAGEIMSVSSTKMILLGGNDVVEMAALLKKEFPDAINLAGKTNLDESAHLIKHAHLVFTGDTGLMHMAAAFKKKIVVLWGNTTPAFGMFPYYGKNATADYLSFENKNVGCRPCSKLGFSTCPKGHFDCMEKLYIDEQAIIDLEKTV